jgi:hypothetical protein
VARPVVPDLFRRYRCLGQCECRAVSDPTNGGPLAELKGRPALPALARTSRQLTIGASQTSTPTKIWSRLFGKPLFCLDPSADSARVGLALKNESGHIEQSCSKPRRRGVAGWSASLSDRWSRHWLVGDRLPQRASVSCQLVAHPLLAPGVSGENRNECCFCDGGQRRDA